MNAAKELFEKIKAVFNEPIAPPAAPAAPVVAPVTLAAKTYKLKDGTEVSISQAGDVIAPGDSVTVGGLVPAEGVIILEDGTAIAVDATGRVVSVEIPPPVTTDLANEPAGPTLEQRIATLETILANQAQATALAAEERAEATGAFAAQVTQTQKHEKTITDLFELVEMLVKEPSADPVTLTGAKKEKFDKLNDKEARQARMAEHMKKQKALS